MTERIYIQIDDRELSELISKLDNSMERLRSVDKETLKLGTRSKSLTTDLESLRVRVMSGTLDLSELSTGVDETMGRLVQIDLFGNRIRAETFKLNARSKAIITRLPGLREANMLWREIQALSTAAGGVEGVAGLVSAGASTLLLMLAIMTLMKRLERIQKQIIRDMMSYEGLVREGLDITHEEYLAMDKTVVGYATLWEDLMADLEAAKSMGYLEGRWQSWAAISDYIAARVVRIIPADYRPAHIPPGVPKPPTPKWMLDMREWWDNLSKDRDYSYDANIEVPPGE